MTTKLRDFSHGGCTPKGGGAAATARRRPPAASITLALVLATLSMQVALRALASTPSSETPATQETASSPHGANVRGAAKAPADAAVATHATRPTQLAQLVSHSATAAATDAATGPSPAAGTASTDTSGGQPIQEVVVTGSHIARSQYDTPTPVAVLSAQQIDAAAPQNLADFVNTLPQISGSATNQNSEGSLSNGESGVSALDLRSLGTDRTLVLVDGRRDAPSTIEGLVDINTIPQELVSRVEVVTGGASAAYGSGAVGGVVNFILDTDYTGLKTSYQYGEADLYGDASRKFTLTAGTPLFDGRGHVLFSGEVAGENGVNGVAPAWDQSGYFAMPNPNTAPGQPYYIVGHDIGVSTYTPGGLITSGPLQGTYFGVNGTVNQLAYGPLVAGQWMQGGNWQYTTSGELGSNSLAPQTSRDNAFSRFSYDLTDDVEAYAEASYARYSGLSYYIQPTTTDITIYANNAFLPPSIRTEMAQLGLSSFTMGTSNADMPPSGSQNTRMTQHYLGGLDGKFDLFGKTVKWDTYVQMGRTNTIEEETPTYNTNRLALATDAVVNPATGQIVCQSTLTDPTNGCVPLDRFGIGVASPQALAWVLGDPERHEQFLLEEGAANFSIADLAGWDGPISLAWGAEGRKEAVSGYVDPFYETGWKYGNYMATIGSYTVAEGYLETLVPLLPGLDFNGAGRFTSYSTSGSVETWKLGLTYKPVDDVTFRVTRSRDIRAANLAELFATGVARTNNVEINGQSVSFVQDLLGNPNVKPEEAITDGYGVVFQPSWLPGLAASVDYYDIKISGVISYIPAQTVADFCFQSHVQSYCNQLNYVGGVLNTIDLYYTNLDSMRSRGIDFDLTYQRSLSDLFSGVPGTLAFHAQATHYIQDSTNNGVTDINLAGVNENEGGGVPYWVYRLEAIYALDPWTFDLTARGVSAGVVNTAFIQCSTNCPPAVFPNYTINDNQIAGAIFFDTSLTRSFKVGPFHTQLYFSIKNVLNRAPPLAVDADNEGAENTPGYLQTNESLYDILGRVWALGIRMQL